MSGGFFVGEQWLMRPGEVEIYLLRSLSGGGG